MLKIAHRGNINGPDLENENTIKTIFTALGKGFDVEIDVWVIDGIIYFGHDRPKEIIDQFIIDKINTNGWFHCKNIEALLFFSNNYDRLNYFWHEEDSYTLTSFNYIWTYPGKIITPRSILVDLNIPNLKSYDIKPYGICTDYPSLL
jgi:hypothetical protein